MKTLLRWRIAPVLLFLLAAGCDGDNRFTGPAGGGGAEDGEIPTVLAVRVPEFVGPSDVLEVEIEATAAEGIRAVDVTLIEDVVRDRRLTIDPPDASLNAFTEFQLPTTLTRTSVLIRVVVEDQQGNRSEPLEVEVPVVQDEDTF